MSRPSSIDQLEPDLRAQINRLRVDKGYTIEQIVEFLKTMNVAISQSAMGRHVKKLAEVGSRIREARAVAEGLAPTLANKDDGQLLNLNIELLQSAAMRVLSATDDGEDVELSANEVKSLGQGLQAAAAAQKINADRVLKIRAQVGQDVKKAIDKVAGDVAGGDEKPDAKAVLKRIREEVYGLFEQPST